LINSYVGRWLALPANVRGIAWLSAGTLLLALSDAVTKGLGHTIHPFELSFFRYAVAIAVLAPVFLRMGTRDLRTARPGLHVIRLFLATIGQTGLFVAVVNLTLADATALGFSKPLFTTVIAIFLLSEYVSRRRWVLTTCGFIGVIVMLRPGAGVIDPYALVAIGAAFCMAVANVLIRVMAPTEPPSRILFYYHLGGLLLLALPAAWVWSTPIGWDWALIVAMGTGLTLGMVCFVRGFSIAEANAIGPSEYVRLIYAGLIGYMLFGESVDSWTVAGGLFIVASTLLIARDEARKTARHVPGTRLRK
jgi:drug/metabolite transporter (DMT)-like permease